MKVFDLNSVQRIWHTTDCVVTASNQRKCRSDLHLATRQLLLEKFPTLSICEEVPIVLRKGEVAYLDFYIPLLKLAIEVNGEQHFKYVPFYHGSPKMFMRAKKRDRDKREWCDLNGIKCLDFNYNEDINQWKAKL